MRQLLQDGKVLFDPTVLPKIKDSLLAVRTGKDGEIDLSTVNSTVRSMALAVNWFSDRQELKEKIPISKLQRAYFDHLDINFGSYYRAMVDRGLSPNQVAMGMANDSEAVQTLGGCMQCLAGIFSQFAFTTSYPHVESMQTLWYCLIHLFEQNSYSMIRPTSAGFITS